MSRNTLDQPQTEHTAEVAAVSDGATTLFAADFDDAAAAWEAYDALTSIQNGRHLAIDGVVVVRRGASGEPGVQKATDHSTKRGMTWGLVGGGVVAKDIKALAKEVDER